MHPRCQCIVGKSSEIFTAIMACKGEVEHAPEGGGRNFEQYPEGGTDSVTRKVDPAKSGYLTFDPGGMSTINWSPTGGQVSYPPGEIQVHIPGRSKIALQLYQSQRTVAKF